MHVAIYKSEKQDLVEHCVKLVLTLDTLFVHLLYLWVGVQLMLLQ